MAKQIVLPNQWEPRPYQLPVMRAMDSGIKRAILVWPRRAGKDSCCGNLLAKKAWERTSNLWYLFPTARQARTVFWEYVDGQGRKALDQMFPEAIRKRTRNDEMTIEFRNGSILKVAGADNIDSLVGGNPAGVVLSEFAVTSPLVLRYIMPILTENGGWLIINSTPRGRNHLYDLFETNKDNPDWFVERLGWRDTGHITQAMIDADVRAGMPEQISLQEYDCNWDAQNVGVVYRRQMDLLRAQGRIGAVPYNRNFPVETATDVGHRDATSTWFYQEINGERRFIDFWEERGSDLPTWAAMIHGKGYAYSRHIGPHDLENGAWAAGKPVDMARNFGIHFSIAPKISIEQGINAARVMLTRCRFDETLCAEGLERLEHYEFKWDEVKRIFGSEPLHNWASHAADALRYAAVVPEELALVPDWARAIVPSHGLGHNGGPSMVAEKTISQPDYNPLSFWTS